jgi:uncharacterized delta-60 repeat protein
MGKLRLASIVAGSLAVLTALPASIARAAPGDLDPTFGRDGKVLTDVSRGFDAAAGVVIQPDGRVVAAGMAGGRGGRFGLVRYRAGGRLDRSFGGDGKVLTNFTRHDDLGTGVALQADGKIVVVGNAQRFASNGTVLSRFAVVRYLADGTPDPAFAGGDGRRTIRFSRRGYDVAQAVAIQPDGKIVLAGSSNVKCNCSRFALVRLAPDGSLDPTFGGDGRVTTRFREGAEARAVAIAPSGAIVASGGLVPESGRFDVARYTPNGLLDPTFSGNGKVGVDVGRGEEEATSVAVQPDERLVVAGYTDYPHEFGDSFFGKFAVLRFAADGTLDPSFGGGDGIARTRFRRQTAASYAMALQSNGRIVAVGAVAGDFALVRYLADGTPDPSFGGDGRIRTDFASDDLAAAVDVRSGRIVAAGVSAERFAVARYLVS